MGLVALALGGLFLPNAYDLLVTLLVMLGAQPPPADKGVFDALCVVVGLFGCGLAYLCVRRDRPKDTRFLTVGPPEDSWCGWDSEDDRRADNPRLFFFVRLELHAGSGDVILTKFKARRFVDGFECRNQEPRLWIDEAEVGTDGSYEMDKAVTLPANSVARLRYRRYFRPPWPDGLFHTERLEGNGDVVIEARFADDPQVRVQKLTYRHDQPRWRKVDDVREAPALVDQRVRTAARKGWIGREDAAFALAKPSTLRTRVLWGESSAVGQMAPSEVERLRAILTAISAAEDREVMAGRPDRPWTGWWDRVRRVRRPRQPEDRSR